jgi:hypothetical protein
LPLNLAILKAKVVAQIFLFFFEVPLEKEGATGIASELLRGNQKQVQQERNKTNCHLPCKEGRMTFRGSIKKEKQKQTAVCLFASEEENVTFGVLIKNYTVVVKPLLRCNRTKPKQETNFPLQYNNTHY